MILAIVLICIALIILATPGVPSPQSVIILVLVVCAMLLSIYSALHGYRW